MTLPDSLNCSFLKVFIKALWNAPKKRVSAWKNTAYTFYQKMMHLKVLYLRQKRDRHQTDYRKLSYPTIMYRAVDKTYQYAWEMKATQ